jgi:hypothetical protein
MGRKTELDALARTIPEKFLPFAEQAMLNMALRGISILVGSHNISPSLIKKGKRINADYEQALHVARGGKIKHEAPSPVTAMLHVNIKPGPKSPPPPPLLQSDRVVEALKEPDKKAPRKRTPRKATAKAGPPKGAE